MLGNKYYHYWAKTVNSKNLPYTHLYLTRKYDKFMKIPCKS